MDSLLKNIEWLTHSIMRSGGLLGKEELQRSVLVEVRERATRSTSERRRKRIILSLQLRKKLGGNRGGNLVWLLTSIPWHEEGESSGNGVVAHHDKVW